MRIAFVANNIAISNYFDELVCFFLFFLFEFLFFTVTIIWYIIEILIFKEFCIAFVLRISVAMTNDRVVWSSVAFMNKRVLYSSVANLRIAHYFFHLDCGSMFQLWITYCDQKSCKGGFTRRQPLIWLQLSVISVAYKKIRVHKIIDLENFINI